MFNPKIERRARDRINCTWKKLLLYLSSSSWWMNAVTNWFSDLTFHRTWFQCWYCVKGDAPGWLTKGVPFQGTSLEENKRGVFYKTFRYLVARQMLPSPLCRFAGSCTDTKETYDLSLEFEINGESWAWNVIGPVDCLERIWKAHNKVFCGYLSVLHKRIEISCVGVRSAMIVVVYSLYRKSDLLAWIVIGIIRVNLSLWRLNTELIKIL